MKKQLNIKKLVKGMRVEDKAKLLFADGDKRAETSGREGLLTPEEKKALIEDAQELHQVDELNRLNRLSNIASFVLLDAQTAYLHFCIAERRLVAVFMGIILVGEGSAVLDRVIYDLAAQGYTDQQLEEKKFQKEIEKKEAQLRKKYETRGGLSDSYDYFNPSLRGKSDFSTQSEPNKLLQKAFMQVIDKVKDFKKQVYQCDYVVEVAKMELLSDRQKRNLKGFSEEVDDFINLRGYLGFIKMYKSFADKGLIRTTKLSEPKFLLTVKDMKKATSLGKKEKDNAQDEIEKVIQKNSS